MIANLSEIRSRVGILGGLQTALTYPHETRVTWGALGGRPRARRLNEMLPLQKQVKSKNNDEKEVVLPRGYPQLKKIAKALRMEILSRSPSSI